MPLPIWPAPTMPTDLMATCALGSPLRARSNGVPGFFVLTPASMTPCSFTTPVACLLSSGLLAGLLQLCLQLRQYLEQVRHQSVVGDLEDRRLAVLVDGDDHLAVLHAGEMLDSPGNAHRDVELGRHHFAGLAHLVVVGHVAGIHRGAAGPHRGTQLVGHRLDVLLEVLARLQTTPARD